MSEYSSGLPRRAPFALAIALSGQAFAADPVLEPITVRARPDATIGFGESSVNGNALRRSRPASSDTAGMLRDIPGVSVNEAGGVSSLPSVRGLADDRLRIKVDGMDLISSCPNHMNPPLSYLDPANLGELSVYAGITPVSVGGDSIGGTIVANPPAPTFAQPGEGTLSQAEAGGFYRSNNDAVGVNVAATRASENFNINYSGAWSKADNYTAGGDFKTDSETGRPGHTLARDEVGSTAYETQNHTLGFAFKSGDNLFEGRLGYQNMPEQLYPNQRMDLVDNTQKRGTLRWLRGFAWGEVEASAYHETVDHEMDFGADKRFWYGANSAPPNASQVGSACAPPGFLSCAAGMPMVSEGTTTGASVKATVDLTVDSLVRVGGEYQRYRLDDYWPASGGGMWPGTFQNINDGERDRAAVFAEWEKRITPAWLTLVGLRYERVTTDTGNVRGYKVTIPSPGNQIPEAAAFNAQDHDRADSNIDFTALARYTRDKNLDIEFGFARKVRSPNLYERYTWSTWAMPAVMNNFVGDGNGYVGDINLTPETAYTVSATFDWHAADRSWELQATPYYTRVNDYIDAIKLPGWAENQFNVLQYANQSARLYGLDVAGHMPLGRNAWGVWRLKGLIGYVNGKNRDTGDALYNIMPLNAKITLAHERGAWENALEIIAVKGKDDVSEVRNEIDTAGYTLVNLRGSYAWKRVRLDFGAENLFDKFYTQPTGGAYTGQGSTMAINGIPWGIGVPGMGRSLYVGVNVKF